MSGVGRVLDLLLPTEPTGSASKNSVSALWLGPDQWLVTCPADDTPFFISSLREALGDSHHALTDLSDGLVTFTLAGPSARDVLAKGCPLDLHPRAFTPGSCARSLLAKADVLLHLHADEPPLRPPRRPLLRAVPLDLARGRRPRIRRADHGVAQRQLLRGRCLPTYM